MQLLFIKRAEYEGERGITGLNGDGGMRGKWLKMSDLRVGDFVLLKRQAGLDAQRMEIQNASGHDGEPSEEEEAEAGTGRRHRHQVTLRMPLGGRRIHQLSPLGGTGLVPVHPYQTGGSCS